MYQWLIMILTYSTKDEYQVGYKFGEALINEIKELQGENQQLKEKIEEVYERLKFALKCKDSELQCVFEAYEIEQLLETLKGDE